MCLQLQSYGYWDIEIIIRALLKQIKSCVSLKCTTYCNVRAVHSFLPLLHIFLSTFYYVSLMFGLCLLEHLIRLFTACSFLARISLKCCKAKVKNCNMLNSQIEFWPKNLILVSFGRNIPLEFVINTTLRKYFADDKSSWAVPVLCDTYVFAKLVWFIKR